MKRCQVNPNMMAWSPFTLGPRPTPVRCERVPRFVAVENKPAVKDGRIGAMSLCGDCLALYRKSFPPTHAKVHPIPQ